MGFNLHVRAETRKAEPIWGHSTWCAPHTRRTRWLSNPELFYFFLLLKGLLEKGIQGSRYIQIYPDTMSDSWSMPCIPRFPPGSAFALQSPRKHVFSRRILPCPYRTSNLGKLAIPISRNQHESTGNTLGISCKVLDFGQSNLGSLSCCALELLGALLELGVSVHQLLDDMGDMAVDVALGSRHAEITSHIMVRMAM